MTASIVATRVLHKGWTTLSKLTVRLADGSEVEREVEDHGRAVAVLPYDPERRVALLVQLMRVPVLLSGENGGELVEAPAGIMDEQDPAETVRREAMEEVGLQLGRLEPVASVWPSPGISTERIALFLAPYAAADRVGRGGGLDEENENITVLEMPLGELWSMFENGRLTDLKTIALLLTLRQRRPELFAPA